MATFRASDITKPEWKQAIAAAVAEKPKAKPSHVAGRMNGTEARYAGRLAMDDAVMRFEFEKHKLPLIAPSVGRAKSYKPDFKVFFVDGCICFDEVKGAYIYEDSTVKFDLAAAVYPRDWWRMWQWKDGGWSLIREHKPRASCVNDQPEPEPTASPFGDATDASERGARRGCPNIISGGANGAASTPGRMSGASNATPRK